MAHRWTSSVEDIPFLEPPHSHNPSHVLHLIALPTAILSQLPHDLHAQLWSLQESTSVLFASHTRLQSLLSSRFDRLVPLRGMYSYSETAFFNYVNQLTTERTYLLVDAYLDWRHKFRSILCALSSHLEKTVRFRGESITIQEWMRSLSGVVEMCSDYARKADMLDFDNTVRQFQLSLTTTPTPRRSPLARVSEDGPVDGTGLHKGLEKL